MRLRQRSDGWSAHIQCSFLAALYTHGTVAAAAKAVGRSRASAYKLRKMRGAESFAKSWDRVLEGPRLRTGLKTQFESAHSPQISRTQSSRPQSERRTQSVRRAGSVSDWRKLTHEELFWRVQHGLWRPVIYRGKMCAIAKKPDNTALFRLLSRLDGRQKEAGESGESSETEGEQKISNAGASVCHRGGQGERLSPPFAP